MILVNNEDRMVTLNLPKHKLRVVIGPNSESEPVDDKFKPLLARYIQAFNLQVKQSATVTHPELAPEPEVVVEEKAEEAVEEKPETPKTEVLSTDNEPENNSNRKVRRQKRQVNK